MGQLIHLHRGASTAAARRAADTPWSQPVAHHHWPEAFSRDPDGLARRYEGQPVNLFDQLAEQPPAGGDVSYRGWECSYDGVAAFWGAEPWRAAKGGWDLDCRQTSGRTWSDLLDEIDAEEEA